MRKTAALLVLNFAMTLHGQSQPPSSRNGEQQSQGKNPKSKGDKTQPSATLQGTQASPLWVNVNCPGCSRPNTTGSTNQTNDKPTQNRREDPNWWVAVFTGLLAVIAFIQAGFFWRQLRMMRIGLADNKAASDAARDAAKAAQDGAEAALLNAKAIINTERPWLVIGVKQINNTDTGALALFVFTCLNQGNTPAQIKQIDANYRIVTDPFDLPVPMTEGDVNPRTLPQRTFIVHKDSFTIRPEINPESILFDHRNGVKQAPGEFLMFFGRIKYHDVFQSWGPGRKAHETRWCYWYNETDGTLIPAGPDEYNKHT
jgi:hypothetical protein